jgi:activator of HSP90 ATPase
MSEKNMSEKKNSAAVVLAPTRRQIIAGVGMAFGGVAVSRDVWGKARQAATEPQSTGADKLRTFLHQEVEIKASPQRIYEVLLDSKQFAAFTGLPAEIDPQAGGAFSLFGGLIVGRNVELVPNQRIVQAWRPASWDPGVYSIVEFGLKQQGPETRIVLDHTGFPEGKFAGLDSGWHERYWEPLKKFLA